jgi:hypothetical protein
MLQARSLLALVPAAMLVACAPRASVVTDPNARVTVQGRISDCDTRVGIPNALVTAANTDFKTTAGGEGLYKFEVPAGSITIQANATGYAQGENIANTAVGGISTQDICLKKL